MAIGFTYEGVGERNKVVLANVQLAYQPSCMYAGKKIANFMQRQEKTKKHAII